MSYNRTLILGQGRLILDPEVRMFKIIFIIAMLLSGVGTVPALIILMMWDASDSN